MPTLLKGPEARARNTAWSASRITLYEQCPRRYKLTHLDKLPTVKSPAAERGIAVHKVLEDYLNGQSPDIPEDIEHVLPLLDQVRDAGYVPEQKWAFRRDWRPARAFFGRDVWLRIVPDAVLVWDGADGKHAEIIDWKTGKKRGVYRVQMALYAAGLFCLHPDVVRVRVRLVFVDEKDWEAANVLEEFDAGQLDQMKAHWEARVKPFFNDDVFAPRPSDKCRWCDFNRNNGGPCEYG